MEKTTLWKLLKERVTVPVIQRDYAQGRVGKEYLRQDFLRSLRNALKPGAGSTVSLDFVYGVKASDRFYPLDGQQRLTTLWLLHWYLAFLSGRLADPETKTRLSRFSYETRSTSREFCAHLCEINCVPSENDSVVETIQNQTWFQSVWKQDPTIVGMLRSLSGVEVEEAIPDLVQELGITADTTSKTFFEGLASCRFGYRLRAQDAVRSRKPSAYIREQTWYIPNHPTVKLILDKLDAVEDPDDGIEKCFHGTKEQAKQMLQWLTDGKAVDFFVLPIGSEQLPHPDDLYIKMNARGRPLSDFEDFKADLLNNEKLWASDDLNSVDLASKVDNAWTDLFWAVDPSNGRIDELFFAFLNRFFLNEYLLSKVYTQWEIFQKRSDRVYNHLLGTFDDNKEFGTVLPYQDFQIYTDTDPGVVNPDSMKRLTKVLDGMCEACRGTAENIDGEKVKRLLDLCRPSWKETTDTAKATNFVIPIYAPDAQKQNRSNSDTLPFSGTTLPLRAAFYAVCRYFEEGTYDETSFRQWMRVAWNEIQNANIDGVPALGQELKLIKSLVVDSHNIYRRLTSGNVNPDDLGTKSGKVQLKEETRKAEWIYEGGTVNCQWEDIFTEAERHPFFRGAISCLLNQKNLKEAMTLKIFESRCGLAKRIFDEKGFAPDYRKEHLLLRALIAKIRDFDSLRNHEYTDTDSGPGHPEPYLKRSMAIEDGRWAAFRGWLDQWSEDQGNDGFIQNLHNVVEADSPFQNVQLKRMHEILYRYSGLHNWMEAKSSFNFANRHSSECGRFYISKPGSKSYYTWILVEGNRNEILTRLLQDQEYSCATQIKDNGTTLPFFSEKDVTVTRRISDLPFPVFYRFLVTDKKENLKVGLPKSSVEKAVESPFVPQGASEDGEWWWKKEYACPPTGDVDTILTSLCRTIDGDLFSPDQVAQYAADYRPRV